MHRTTTTTATRRLRQTTLAALAMASLLAITATAAGQTSCRLGWLPTFSENGINNIVRALEVKSSGEGSILYAGGSFSHAGGVQVNGIAQWDHASSEWLPLDSGVNFGVYSLAVYDDQQGDGPALFVGGDFTTTVSSGIEVNHIAKWDGTKWSPLGSGLNGRVDALAVFDDGSGNGPALYVGGSFTMAGEVPVSRIARWDGSEWSPLGSGMSGGVTGGVSTLHVFDDGGGLALYAGGQFTSAGGVSANRIAKWDGNEWSALGNGVSGSSPRVWALTVHEGGLYAGGRFTTAGNEVVSHIARWDGITWSAVGSGVSSGNILSLTVFDDNSGGGPAVYAGGSFTLAGEVEVNRIAKWDGATWSALGDGFNNTVEALAVNSMSESPSLYAGGRFTTFGNGNRIAEWGCCEHADLNCDGVVDVSDLLILLAAWGPCSRSSDCTADINDDGTVDVSDLLILLANWG